MLKWLFIVPLYLIFAQKGQSQSTYTDTIQAYQKLLAHTFSDLSTTPLDSFELAHFTGYTFLPIDQNYAVEARLRLTPRKKPFEMATSGIRKPLYKQYGVLTFHINGKRQKLSVYQNLKLIGDSQYNLHLFLPFKDLTNGDRTYGGGRFLDLTIPEGNTIIIDFNRAYNPYCAWSYRYSCALPPPKNHLNIAIPVGASFNGVEH